MVKKVKKQVVLPNPSPKPKVWKKLSFFKPPTTQIRFFEKTIYFKKAIILFLGLNILIILLLLLIKKFLPPQIPLYYGLPEGEQQLAGSLYLMLPSFVSLILAFVNILLAKLINDEFLGKALIVSAIVCSIFSVITIVKIFFLVGSLF